MCEDFFNVDVLCPKLFQTLPEKTIKTHGVQGNRNRDTVLKTALRIRIVKHCLVCFGHEDMPPATWETRTTLGSNAKMMNLHISDALYFAFDVWNLWYLVQFLI